MRQAEKKYGNNSKDEWLHVDRDLFIRETIIRMAAKEFFNLNPSTREITVAISDAGNITVDLANADQLGRRLRGLLHKIREGGVTLGVQRGVDENLGVWLEADSRTLINRNELDRLNDEVQARASEIVRFFGGEGVFDSVWLGKMMESER
jgi:hypothetical protein